MYVQMVNAKEIKTSLDGKSDFVIRLRYWFKSMARIPTLPSTGKKRAGQTEGSLERRLRYKKMITDAPEGVEA